jgi:hypothetical protein
MWKKKEKRESKNKKAKGLRRGKNASKKKSKFNARGGGMGA